MNRLIAILGLLWCLGASAAEVIPPKPAQYFNDYAGVTSQATAEQLNRKLEDFEKATSSQVVVAIFPKMESDSSVDDYTVRVARAWKVGQKEKNNGVVLFIFVQDHKMFIQIGPGLQGALPDAIGKRIISAEIAPRFKQGDFDGGVTAGVNAILAATKGEYQGNGQTVGGQSFAERQEIHQWIFWGIIVLVIVLPLLAASSRSGRRGGGGFIFFGGGGGWSGGGGGGGWSGGGGGGGGFSGGGGSFDGGGAGGSW